MKSASASQQSPLSCLEPCLPSCKSGVMQLQIQSTVAKCRGSWASERPASSGAAQHKHFHGQEKQVILEHSTEQGWQTLLDLLWFCKTQAFPTQHHLIVTGTTGRSGFAGIETLLLCAQPELKSLEKFKTPFPAPKYHPVLWASQWQHSASVLRRMIHKNGGTKWNTRVPEACECREPQRLHNTSHGKAKQLPHRARSGSVQGYSSARTGWGHAECWRGAGTAIQTQHPPANRGSCSLSSPALSSSLPESAPQCLLSWEAKVGWDCSVLQLRTAWVCMDSLSIRSSLLEAGFYGTYFPEFPHHPEKKPCCTSFRYSPPELMWALRAP